MHTNCCYSKLIAITVDSRRTTEMMINLIFCLLFALGICKVIVQIFLRTSESFSLERFWKFWGWWIVIDWMVQLTRRNNVLLAPYGSQHLVPTRYGVLPERQVSNLVAGFLDSLDSTPPPPLKRYREQSLSDLHSCMSSSVKVFLRINVWKQANIVSHTLTKSHRISSSPRKCGMIAYLLQ